MKRRRHRWLREELVAPWLTLAAVLGLWWLGSRLLAPSRDDSSATRVPDISAPVNPSPSNTTPSPGAAPPASGAAVEGAPKRDNAPEMSTIPTGLPDGRLMVPVVGIDRSSLTPMFSDARGVRTHEAIDILAPRGTPVIAALDGRVEKLFTSNAGGLTVYQFDPDASHAYYYAHLDRYADGLAEGQQVKGGQTIGYVGTSGNAPPETPHLHFAIFKLGAEKRWWQGEAIDPYPLLREN